jgi:tetratricopeptide (TPR) repeat protein
LSLGCMAQQLLLMNAMIRQRNRNTEYHLYLIAREVSGILCEMSSHHSSAPEPGASLPHPDSYAQDLLTELSTAVEAFKKEHRAHHSLAAVAKAFKRAASVLDRCAPLSGEHAFLVGERVIMCNLRQRADLNGCLAIVKCKANVVDGDGRVEVSVGTGSKKEMMRVRPVNLRLDWHVAADAHVTAAASRVVVRSIDSTLRGQVCQVVSSDPCTSLVTVRATGSGPDAAGVDVSVSGLVPAIYFIIAKEVQDLAVKIALQAAGVSATPAVTAVINAAHSCAEFYIRCARGAEAARVCVSVMEALHMGGQTGTTPSSRLQDYYERLAWISKFLGVCLHHVDVKLQAHSWLDDACSLLMLCKDVINSIQGSDSYNFFVLLNNLAGLHMKQRRLDDAEALYKEALRIRELNFHPLAGLREQSMMYESYDVSIAATQHNLAMVHMGQLRFDEAEVLYRDVLQKQLQKLGRDSLDVAATLHNLAVLHNKQERLEDAEAIYNESIRIRELKQGPDSMEVAENLTCLSMVYLKQNRVADAEGALERTLRIQRLKLGQDSLDTCIADTLTNLALVYVDQRRFSEAEELHREALRIYTMNHGHDSLMVSSVLSNLAGLLAKDGRLEESETMFRESMRIVELLLGRQSLEVACELSNIGAVVCSLERYAEGEELHMEALRIRESKLGHESVEVTVSLKHLGTLYQKLERLDEAEAMYTEALRIREMRLGRDAFSVVELRSKLAELHPPPLSDI